ncbi:MAG: cyclic nucleotide-binding domain-containing protein [Mariprofundaceae bacterium]
MFIKTELEQENTNVGYAAMIAANKNFMTFRSMQISNELNDIEAMSLFSCMGPRQFPIGETIYQAGEASKQEVFLILEGKVSATDRSGHQFCQLRAGDVFGLFSFLDEGRCHSATLKTETDTVVLTIDRSYFDMITLEDPSLGNQLLRFMFRLLSRMALKTEVEYANIHGYALGRKG